jgi:hypothetical protein
LRIRQSVTITLDDVEGSFDCYIRAVDGAVANLGQAGGIAEDIRKRLSPGVMGHMLADSGGTRVSMRGIATELSGSRNGFAFVVLDQTDLPERRKAARVPLIAVVRIIAVDDIELAAPLETVTSDLSQAGALIQRRGQLSVGREVELAFQFLDTSEMVHCRGEVIRETATHVAVSFTTMLEHESKRLAVILRQHRR